MSTPAEAKPDDIAADTESDRGVVLARYYAGESVPCPVGCGDRAEAVRVITAESGEGVIWMECLGCAQRERYVVPAATTDERERVREMAADDGDAICPRHDRPTALRPRGRQLVCPACGVRYRE